MSISCAERALVAKHFEGTIAPADERRMRAHLPGCAACRRHYDRHALLGELDPMALATPVRLARPLGLSREGVFTTEAAPPSSRARGPWGAVASAVAIAASALLLLRAASHGPSRDGFQSRGANASSGSRASSTFAAPPASHLRAVRFADGLPRPTVGELASDDELAFSYDAPEGAGYVMIVAVDAAGATHWYYPPSAEAGAASAAIERAPGWHELPEAIRQPLASGPLTILAAFSAAPVESAVVEARLRRGEAASQALAAMGATVEALDLEVRP
jgi:hypothetical protein